MPFHSKNVFLLFILLIFFFDVSMASPEPTGEKPTGGTLTFSYYDKFGVINPLLSSATISSRLSGLIFDGLVQLNEQYEISPHLAHSWEVSEDQKTWIFHLKQGIQFHDGVELSADDVVYTITQLMKLPMGSRFHFLVDALEEVKAVDRYTLQIKLNKTITSFLEILDIGVLPKHLFEGKTLQKGVVDQHPIGSGPFKLKSWSEKEIILEANQNYFLGRPYLDQIRAVYFPSREAAWAKLISGEIDFFTALTPNRYQTLKEVPDLKRYASPLPFYYSIAFNLKDPIFADLKVRQALNYAVDKEKIVEKVLLGQGRVAAGTIFHASWAYNPSVQAYPYDPKKALALLKKAGWTDHDGDYFLDKDGTTFEFTVHVNSGDDLKQKTLLLVQQDLFDIGIKMQIRLFQLDNIDFLFKKQFQAHFPEIVARGDPDFSYQHWHSSQITGGFNVSSYSNAVVDRLLEAGRRTFDPTKRKQIYFAYQEEIHRDPPAIFLFWTDTLAAVHHRFKGVKINSAYPFGSNIHEWIVPKSQQK